MIGIWLRTSAERASLNRQNILLFSSKGSFYRGLVLCHEAIDLLLHRLHVIFAQLFGFFAALGVHVNIFAIFGLILASAVGIDYLIFALSEDLSRRERVFGIFAAFITSFISFFALSFSQTPAVSVFGLAVSLCVAFYGLAACTLAMKNLA